MEANRHLLANDDPVPDTWIIRVHREPPVLQAARELTEVGIDAEIIDVQSLIPFDTNNDISSIRRLHASNISIGTLDFSLTTPTEFIFSGTTKVLNIEIIIVQKDKRIFT